MSVFSAPQVPDWIRSLSYPGYRNVFELNLGNQNLFGTEHLCGDWKGDLLVVAKDFAPFEEVEALAANPLVDRDVVYRHNDGDGRYKTGLKTNRKLVEMLNRIGYPASLSGSGNTTCGALYVSACFLLKTGSSSSSSLPDWRPGTRVFVDAVRVLDFVLDHMPSISAVACLGNDAHSLVEYTQKGRRPALGVFKHLHPSRGARSAHDASWDGMARDCQLKGGRTN
jgi:hypothetical protein